MAEKIEGLWVALATPLTADGAVDHALLVRHVAALRTQGCDGFVLFGTTGEGPSFSAAERLAALEAVLASGIEADRLCLSTGAPAIPDAIALTKSMLGLGLRHALVLPPFYFPDVPAPGLIDAFARIIDGVGDDRLRVTLYHIPQTSGVGVPPGVLAALRKRYGVRVAGLKDSTGDFAQFRAFRAACPDVGILVGNEADIAAALAEGGTGTICGMANAVPLLVRAMFGAAPPTERMTRAIAQVLPGGFIPRLKGALADLTGEPGWNRLRPPLLPVDAAIGRDVAAALRDAAP